MDELWWPDMLRHLANPEAWTGELVTVAELVGYDDPVTPGQRSMWSALISPEDLASLDGDLRAFNHEVESTGKPSAGAEGKLQPRFHISAYQEAQEAEGEPIVPAKRIETEPLVLGWTNNNRTAMVLDPKFTMTYGLMPRALGDGSIHWDDPAAPEFDLAIVDPPSVYEDLRVSNTRTLVSKAHLQDYLSLRGMCLVQVYYETRSAIQDTAIQAALGSESRRIVRLRDREIDFWRNSDGTYTAQVWGARVVAKPGALPITVDDLDHVGLQWPGRPAPVTHGDARKLLPHDWVYVSDTVLGAYEGRPDFDIHPESGGVSFGGQWSVGFCGRVGRDVIRVELKKLHEGTPDRVIRHWHAHAVAPRSEFQGAQAFGARNVAIRTRELVCALVDLGERLSALRQALGSKAGSGSDFVGLDRTHLDYVGWWKGALVEPVARHVPLDMVRDVFLDRCLDLDKLAIEVLPERFLRPMVRKVGAPQDDIDVFRGLKLLDRLACLAQVANEAGLSLAQAGSEIVTRFHRDGTNPAQPLTHLFVISDLRQIKGHRKDEVDARVKKALARVGIDVQMAAGGWGTVLDRIYDGAIKDLVFVGDTLARTLKVISNVRAEQHGGVFDPQFAAIEPTNRIVS